MGSGGNSVRPRYRRIVRLTEPATVGGLSHGGAHIRRCSARFHEPGIRKIKKLQGDLWRSSQRSPLLFFLPQAMIRAEDWPDIRWVIVDCGDNLSLGRCHSDH